MAKTVTLRRAQKYTIGKITFEKDVPKIVNDALAAILDTKVDTNEVPMFRITSVKKSDIPVVVAPKPVEVLEEDEGGMSDAELEKLEKDQEASRNALQADASEEEIAEVVSQKSVAAGKIRVAKKTAPAGEPAVTV